MMNSLNSKSLCFRAARGGFTMVELLVVIAMLMLLAGAVTTSITSAQRRAKIVQATAEAQEMTNAILAYGHFGEGYSLGNHKMEKQPAAEGNMAFILGEEASPSGSGKTPVLYNASIRGGKLLDPWGHAYLVTIREGKSFKNETDNSDQLKSVVAFPNFNRRPAGN